MIRQLWLTLSNLVCTPADTLIIPRPFTVCIYDNTLQQWQTSAILTFSRKCFPIKILLTQSILQNCYIYFHTQGQAKSSKSELTQWQWQQVIAHKQARIETYSGSLFWIKRNFQISSAYWKMKRTWWIDVLT